MLPSLILAPQVDHKTPQYMPQPSTCPNPAHGLTSPLEHKVQRSTSYREGCGELGSWRGRESQITLCVSRARPCRGVQAAAREVLVSE